MEESDDTVNPQKESDDTVNPLTDTEKEYLNAAYKENSKLINDEEGVEKLRGLLPYLKLHKLGYYESKRLDFGVLLSIIQKSNNVKVQEVLREEGLATDSSAILFTEGDAKIFSKTNES